MDPKKAQFLELWKRTGWTQAELARRLELSRGGINGIITGTTVPSAGLVKLLQLVIFTEKPGLLEAGASELKESMSPYGPVPKSQEENYGPLILELERLPAAERERILANFTDLARLYAAQHPNSAPASAVAAMGRKALAKIRKYPASRRPGGPAITTAGASGKTRASQPGPASAPHPPIPDPK